MGQTDFDRVKARAFIGPSLPATTGEVFFVSNSTTLPPSGLGGSDGNDGLSPMRPFKTLDYAVGRCTASRGDVIVVMPGHAETYTAAAGLDLDIAGIFVIGLGVGTNRPTFSMSTATTVDIDIDAANISISNLEFSMIGIDAIVAGIDVNSADFRMSNCRVLMSDATGQAVLAVLGDAAADRWIIEDCKFEAMNAGAAAAIRLVGSDECIIRRNKIYGDFSVANISVLTTAVTNILIEENDLDNRNAVDVCIEGLAASTGSIRRNTCRVATDAQVTYINTGGNMQLYENYGVNNNGETGQLIGTVSV